MSAAIFEQETSIHFMRDSDWCKVYTSDTTMMTRLDKLVAEGGPWKVISVQNDMDGKLVSKIYEAPKRLVSFRARTVTRVMTDEQREAARERLRSFQEKARLAREHGRAEP